MNFQQTLKYTKSRVKPGPSEYAAIRFKGFKCLKNL